MCACNSSTWEVKAEESLQGYAVPQQVGASLGFVKTQSKTSVVAEPKTNQKGSEQSWLTSLETTVLQYVPGQAEMWRKSGDLAGRQTWTGQRYGCCGVIAATVGEGRVWTCAHGTSPDPGVT